MENCLYLLLSLIQIHHANNETYSVTWLLYFVSLISGFSSLYIRMEYHYTQCSRSSVFFFIKWHLLELLQKHTILMEEETLHIYFVNRWPNPIKIHPQVLISPNKSLLFGLDPHIQIYVVHPWEFQWFLLSSLGRRCKAEACQSPWLRTSSPLVSGTQVTFMRLQ